MTKWDERYSKHEWLYGQKENDFLRECRPKIKPHGRILSLGEGEGEGRNALYLLKQGFRVDAVDLSEVGLNKLRTAAAIADVYRFLRTYVCDLKDFKFEGEAYDAVVAIWLHLESSTRTYFCDCAYRALKPNGHLIIEAYTPEQLKYGTGDPPSATLMYRADELKTTLSERFETLILQETQRMVEEGVGHHGMSAVVQYLGQKKEA
jgi:SAM-dependent methyltransferase